MNKPLPIYVIYHMEIFFHFPGHCFCYFSADSDNSMMLFWQYSSMHCFHIMFQMPRISQECLWWMGWFGSFLVWTGLLPSPLLPKLGNDCLMPWSTCHCMQYYCYLASPTNGLTCWIANSVWCMASNTIVPPQPIMSSLMQNLKVCWPMYMSMEDKGKSSA